MSLLRLLVCLIALNAPPCGFAEMFNIHESGQPRVFVSRARDANGRPIELREAGVTNARARHVTGEILVRTRPGANVARLAQTAGVTGYRAIAVRPNHYLFYAAEPGRVLDLVKALRQEAAVVSAEPVLARQRVRKALPNDPLLAEQWHLINRAENGGRAGIDLHLTNTWNNYRGAGVVIGIVDDGLDTNHPDLKGHIDPALGYDWNDRDSDPSAHPVLGDFHGTECAGLAAAVGNNSLGITGVAYEATIAGLRLISLESTDVTESEALGFKNDQIHVKSNSWGPDDDGKTLEGPGPLAAASLAEGAHSGRGGKGTIYVWAAGNGLDARDNANYDGYANSIYTMAVGSVSDQGLQTDFSEPGACVVVVAPSGSFGRSGITTTDLHGSNGANKIGEPGDYADLDYTSGFVGTSASVPQVAGGAALLLSANSNLGWRDVQEILLRSASVIDEHDLDWEVNSAGLHFNHKYGGGLMNVDAALTLAETWQNLGTWTNRSLVDTNLSLAIPDDDPTGVTREFDFSQTNLRVEHVTLTASINHPFRGDLAITLIAPSGMESRLAEQHADPGANYAEWTFMTVRHWGEVSQGKWKVRIADLKEDDVGTVESLRLTVYGVAADGPNPMSVDSFAFSDGDNGNGNGAIEPGESISGRFVLRNGGAVTLSGTAQVISRTPGVTVLGGSTDISAAAGGTAELPVDFRLSVDVPCQSTLIFDLITELGGVRRTNSLRQAVGPPPGAWQTETIDAAGLVGSYTSLALDSAGRAHISYYDISNGDLKYARQSANGWTVEAVDTNGNVGTYTSIALDALDRARISYRDETQQRLKYAAWNGTDWAIETIPTTVAAGNYSSLKLTRDEIPCIAFMDETNGDLLYAKPSANGWEVQTVDSTNKTGNDISLALNAQNQPMISYRDSTLNDLKFAEWTGTDWRIETIDAGGSVGFTSSLRIGRDGQPRIAYRDSSNTDLKFAQRGASGWAIEVADSSGAVGFDCALALDSQDRPHISYRDLGNNTLKYAVWNGAFWSLQTVDASGLVGAYTSIAVDQNGHPRISYRDNGNSDLKFASLDSTECQVFQSAPSLSINRQGDAIIISWAGFVDATLESSSTLGQSAWIPASAPVSHGAINSVEVSTEGEARFYRLKRN